MRSAEPNNSLAALRIFRQIDGASPTQGATDAQPAGNRVSVMIRRVSFGFFRLLGPGNARRWGRSRTRQDLIRRGIRPLVLFSDRCQQRDRESPVRRFRMSEDADETGVFETVNRAGSDGAQ